MSDSEMHGVDLEMFFVLRSPSVRELIQPVTELHRCILSYFSEGADGCSEARPRMCLHLGLSIFRGFLCFLTLKKQK